MGATRNGDTRISDSLVQYVIIEPMRAVRMHGCTCVWVCEIVYALLCAFVRPLYLEINSDKIIICNFAYICKIYIISDSLFQWAFQNA